MLIKYFSHVTWCLWSIQILFGITSLIEFYSYYFANGNGLDLFSGCFFFFESYHFFRLRLELKGDVGKKLTDFSKFGAFQNFSRNTRRKLKRHFAKMKQKQN